MAALLAVLSVAAATVAAQSRESSNSIGMVLVLIDPGTFVAARFQPECPTAVAGWTAGDYARCKELVRRESSHGFVATIRRPFHIGKYEVTQAEWTAVMGANPSRFQAPRVAANADRHPVDSVTWEDAQAFVRELNARERTSAYRLPTELEWEYAARAGAASDPRWDEIRAQAWEQDVDTAATHPVGGKTPNAWGLHDTLGNVWEWVADYYNEKFFPDPEPPRDGHVHVLKGGGFLSDVKNTVYSTHGAGPGSGFDVGFRIVRDLPQAPSRSANSRAVR